MSAPKVGPQMSKGARCPPGWTYHGTQSNHLLSRASDGPTIAVTFSQPCHSWSQNGFFPLSPLCLDLFTAELRQPRVYFRDKISFTSNFFFNFVCSVDYYNVSRSQVHVWIFVHLNLCGFTDFSLNIV